MSEIQQGPLATFRQTLADKLTADARFQDIPVLTEKLKNIESEIEQALNQATGVCIIVITPLATVTKPNLPGPYFDNVTIIIRIVENVLLSQSREGQNLSASYLAECVANTLHRFVINGKAVVCEKITIVPDKINLVYDVLFKTHFGL